MPTIPVDPHTFHRALMTLEDCVIGGETAPDDYIAVCQGWTVGRIMRDHKNRWAISLYGPASPQPDFVEGTKWETLAEAKREMRRQFDVWLVLAEAAHEMGHQVLWWGPPAEKISPSRWD